MSWNRDVIRRWLERTSAPAIWVRVVPFAVFLGLTGLQGAFGEESRYWFYLVKTVVGAGLLWAVWPLIAEMRWHWSWEALGMGVAVFIMWIGLDQAIEWLGIGSRLHRLPGLPKPWNPREAFSGQPGLAWLMIVMRLAGASLVVPLMEETFYRSFVYRFLIRQDFASVSWRHFDVRSFLFTSLLFALSHHEWLAALLCGFGYQWLVLRKGRVGDAILAHSITNLLLGLWVVGRGQWHFW